MLIALLAYITVGALLAIRGHILFAANPDNADKVNLIKAADLPRKLILVFMMVTLMPVLLVVTSLANLLGVIFAGDDD